jgi:glycosyltransferase involved in cell wall biosynthesis
MESHTQMKATERVEEIEVGCSSSIDGDRKGNFLLSVVVPVYKEEGNITEFLKRLKPILSERTPRFEIIFAMDPSPDRTEEIILQERSSDERIKLLKFSRRVGQPMATIGGMAYSRGDAVIVIDVDLQDPPELIQQMVQKWREGFEVVLAQRLNRKGETWVKQLVSYLGYKFINRVAEVDIPANTGDFRLMSRRVVEEILRLKESHGFLRGLVALVGFRQTTIQFERPARFSGKGNYNRLFGSLKIGLNGVVCFSNYLLTLTSQIGFVIAGLSFVTGVIYALLKICGVPFPLGNPTIVIAVLFIGGVQLISIGILGEYVARIYDEVKNRPKFIVDRAFGFEIRPPNDSSRKDFVRVDPNSSSTGDQN